MRWLFSYKSNLEGYTLSMTRIYRELCENALLANGQYDVKKERKHFGKIEVTYSEGKDNHSYITIATREELFCNPEAKERISLEIKKALTYYLNKMNISEQSRIFIACLGNEKITADSLGGKVADRLIVTMHLNNQDGLFNKSGKYGQLCAVKCGVSGTTGIESFDVIYGLIRQVKPDIVIAIDTLACSSILRLGRTVQFSDGGIEPGGGVGNAKRCLNYDSLKVPVLAIGVPLVIYATRIISEYSDGKIKDVSDISDLVVAAKEIDYICADYADVIADAINRTIHSGIYY